MVNICNLNMSCEYDEKKEKKINVEGYTLDTPKTKLKGNEMTK